MIGSLLGYLVYLQDTQDTHQQIIHRNVTNESEQLQNDEGANNNQSTSTHNTKPAVETHDGSPSPDTPDTLIFNSDSTLHTNP